MPKLKSNSEIPAVKQVQDVVPVPFCGSLMGDPGGEKSTYSLVQSVKYLPVFALDSFTEM